MSLTPFERAIQRNQTVANKYNKELLSIRNMIISNFVYELQQGERNLYYYNHRIEARMILAYAKKLEYYTLTVMFEGETVVEFKKYGSNEGYTFLSENNLTRLIRAMQTA